MKEIYHRASASQILLTVAAFVVVIAGMRAAVTIVVPFLLAVFIAIISTPPLFWLHRKGLPIWLAILLGPEIAAKNGVPTTEEAEIIEHP